MSLKNVKQMGTEGRRDGENEIPPNEVVLGMVKFRVDLIKTFEIIDKPEEEDANDGDPAIISSEVGDEEQEAKKPRQERQPKHTDDWSKGTKIRRSS